MLRGSKRCRRRMLVNSHQFFEIDTRFSEVIVVGAILLRALFFSPLLFLRLIE